LRGAGALVAGSAHVKRIHTTAGVVVGAGATVVGASHVKRIHTTVGVLWGVGARVTGHATIGLPKFTGSRQAVPFLPDGMSWGEWNGNMLHYFGEEPLPHVEEPDWRQLAGGVVLLPTFAVYGGIDPASFEDWREWARQFITVVNGATQ
jgi:hypothetical protein